MFGALSIAGDQSKRSYWLQKSRWKVQILSQKCAQNPNMIVKVDYEKKYTKWKTSGNLSSCDQLKVKSIISIQSMFTSKLGWFIDRVDKSASCSVCRTLSCCVLAVSSFFFLSQTRHVTAATTSPPAESNLFFTMQAHKKKKRERF